MKKLPDNCGIYCSLLCNHCYEETQPKELLNMEKQITEMVNLYNHCNTDSLKIIVAMNASFPVKFFDAVTEWYISNCVAMEDLTNEQIMLKIIIETAGKFEH